MTKLEFMTRGARNFTATFDGRYVADIDSRPERGAIGTNGRKGGWLVTTKPTAPTPIKALDGARFLREVEAEAAIRDAMLTGPASA